tara:strand:- start:4076 stop:4258 length:183 start_codon:yes stop_codon:yes gene_type:complete
MKPKTDDYEKHKRYVVHYKIADEKTYKFFDKKDHAETFATDVGGKITVYTTLERKGNKNG